MAKPVNKTVIGGFVISAIVLLAGSIFLFGGGAFFKKTERYVIFFENSVKGLSVGAPVLFRGVQIGTVSNIVLYADRDSLDVSIPVYIDVDPRRIVVDGSHSEPDIKPNIDRLIRKGLRAVMNLQSLVTGQMMIEMDFYADSPVRLVGMEKGFPEIPSTPSSLDQLSRKLERLPIEEIADKLLSSINGLNNLLENPKLMAIIDNLDTASRRITELVADVDGLIGDADQGVRGISQSVAEVAEEARQLLEDLNGQVSPLANRVQSTLEKAGAAMDKAHLTLESVDSLVGKRSEIRRGLDESLREIAAAARSLKKLTDYLERHPEALLQGKGGK